MKKHGADIDVLKRKYNIDGEVIDFSSNINPNVPKGVKEQYKNSFESLLHYPDIEYYELKKSIAEYINVPFADTESIAVGNGAAELIYSFAGYVEGDIVVVEPTFSEYEKAASVNRKKTYKIYMNKERRQFTYDTVVDQIKEKKLKEKGVSTLIICNPNNPDGSIKNIEEIVEFCRENNMNILVDETFIEFCEKNSTYTALNYDYENIFVLKAATKFFGLPGLRLGYIISRNKRAIREMEYRLSPWSVNSIASEIGKIIFKDTGFISETVDSYKKEREFLYRNLRDIEWLKAYKSDSAFILIEIVNRKITAKKLKEYMIKNYGIAIRNADDYEGLDEYFFRIAIKSREDNKIIIKTLKEMKYVYNN